MADLTEIQASQSVKIAGANPSTGAEDNYADVDGSGNLLVKPTSAGSVTPGTVATNSELVGGQFNTALPTLTNTQQSAIQVDSSGRLIIAPLTSTSIITASEDHNYGTVGANTLRTASQIGNATGASDFAAGNSSGQTLRVVIATNQSALTVTQTTPANLTSLAYGQVQSAAAGPFANGTNNPLSLDASGYLRVTAFQGTSPWTTKDQSDGPVTPGTVASFSQLAGGQFNTTLPTLTTGQQASLQTDSSGRLLVISDLDDVKPATINITVVDSATTTTAIANGQSAFTGTPTAGSAALFVVDSIDTVVVEVTGTWTGTLQIEVSMDGGITWYIRPIHQAGGSSAASFGSFTANFAGGLNVGGWTNVRVRAIAAMTGTATVRVVESINPNSIYVANAIRLVDSSGDLVNITPNNDLNVSDIVNTLGQYRAQSVTTSAAEALGAGSILANRKSLTITPTNGTVYWGYSNAVTTSSGTPIFKNQTASFAVGANVHVFLIAGSTTDCRITEAS